MNAVIATPGGGIRAAHAARRIGLGLFLLALSVYLLTSNGRDYSSDGAQYFYTADAMLQGRLWIEKENAHGARESADGRLYSKAGPLQSVVELPYLAAFRLLARVFDFSAETGTSAARAWVPNATSATLAAGTVVLLYLTVLQLGYGLGVACALGALLAFTTPLWVYGRLDFSEPLQCFLLLGCCYGVIRARPPAAAAAAATGTALGLLVLTKALFIVLAPVFWLGLLWRLRCRTVRDFFAISLATGVPVLLAGLIYLAWNHARWGSALDFGFNETFSTHILIGLHGLFFSSGKSIFLYAPALVLLIAALPRFWRRHPFEAILIAAVSIPIVCIYAQFWAWHGDWAWGPRYLVPLVALWVLPLAVLLATAGLALRALLLAFSLAGVLVQTLGVTVNTGTYLGIHVFQITPAVHGGEPSHSRSQIDVHYVPEFSPLAGHYWLLRATIEAIATGRPPEQNRRLQTFPWRLLGHWKPAHPEYGIGLDLWPPNPPRYMTRSAMIVLGSILSISGIAGLALVASGFGRARSRPA